MTIQTNVYSIDGNIIEKIDVPAIFEAAYRPDIIKRAVLAAAANGRQPYGPAKMSGMRHAVSTRGKGTGSSRAQRIHGLGKASESPNNVSGRRAHPPVPEKVWKLKVNRKERIIARESAIAATAHAECVKARGHRFSEDISFPIVVNDTVQNISTTSDIHNLLKKIGIDCDIDRAKRGTKIRAGRGKMRNRKYRTPTSILFVVSDDDAPILRGACNLPGVQVKTVNSISAAILAPGGDAGRLTVYTKSSIASIGEWSR
ncbi:MAG: 50S ribosomal protein L4 [archaeon]|nr:50S ribosomal protein L4 [archaeon]